MFGAVRHAFGRAFLPVAERLAPDSWANLPRPPESRLVVHAAGPNPDRVLLAGNSLAVGWGVMSHELALGGRLARATASLTGRGLDVDLHVRPDKTLGMVERFLTPETVARFDAILLMLGTREAFQFIPLSTWTRRLGRLLDHVLALADPPPALLVLGADEVTPLPVPERAGRGAIARVRALNAATRELLASRGGDAAFVPSAIVSPSGTGQEFPTTTPLYERAATAIAPALAAALARARAPRDVLDERGRDRAIAEVRARLASDDPELLRLVAVTRDLFGALDSALLLVESEVIEPIVADDSIVRVPRAQSFSAEAVHHHHGFVVPDILADERYRDRPDVTGAPYLRAYAGHRVESPEGHPVAVLAMAFDRARDFSAADLALLRALAHRIGELLFGRP